MVLFVKIAIIYYYNFLRKQSIRKWGSRGKNDKKIQSDNAPTLRKFLNTSFYTSKILRFKMSEIRDIITYLFSHVLALRGLVDFELGINTSNIHLIYIYLLTIAIAPWSNFAN